jgi:predicted ATPase
MMDRYVREIKLRREKVSSFDAYPFSLPGLERVCVEETEHYIVAKRFLNDPGAQLARLLD